jgi:hypothetical protein
MYLFRLGAAGAEVVILVMKQPEGAVLTRMNGDIAYLKHL